MYRSKQPRQWMRGNKALGSKRHSLSGTGTSMQSLKDGLNFDARGMQAHPDI